MNIKSHNCFVCGVTINAKYLALMVGKHIRSEHDMSQEEYYRKYSYKSGDENCSNCGVKVDFNINNFLINKFNDYRKEYYNSIT